jgi:hypothetical protein
MNMARLGEEEKLELWRTQNLDFYYYVKDIELYASCLFGTVQKLNELVAQKDVDQDPDIETFQSTLSKSIEQLKEVESEVIKAKSFLSSMLHSS